MKTNTKRFIKINAIVTGVIMLACLVMSTAIYLLQMLGEANPLLGAITSILLMAILFGALAAAWHISLTS